MLGATPYSEHAALDADGECQSRRDGPRWYGMRAVHRALRVAQRSADLGRPRLASTMLAEALQYRVKRPDGRDGSRTEDTSRARLSAVERRASISYWHVAHSHFAPAKGRPHATPHARPPRSSRSDRRSRRRHRGQHGRRLPLVHHEAVFHAPCGRRLRRARPKSARGGTANHTWSGRAANLSIDPRAGGCFCEKPRTARYGT